MPRSAVRIPTPEDLVADEAPRVYRLCRRLLDNADDAEECAQQSLLRAIERLPTFQGRSSLSTWIFRITINVCRNRRRRDRLARTRHVYGRDTTAEEEMPVRGAYRAPDEALSRVEASRAVAAAIRQLPARQRLVVVLREMEEMRYDEIARTLRIPVGTVRSTLFRARRTLATKLEGVWP